MEFPMMMSTAAGHADVAAEAIRALNHATLPGRGGLAEPADAYEILAQLGLLADRLGQSVRQVQQYLDGQVDRGGIRIVDGEHRDNPAGAISACRQLTADASTAAGVLGRALHAAQETLTWAATTPPPTPDDQFDRYHRQQVLGRDRPGRPPLTR
jgi:hypothetical protein